MPKLVYMIDMIRQPTEHDLCNLSNESSDLMGKYSISFWQVFTDDSQYHRAWGEIWLIKETE